MAKLLILEMNVDKYNMKHYVKLKNKTEFRPVLSTSILESLLDQKITISEVCFKKSFAEKQLLDVKKKKAIKNVLWLKN